VFERVEPRVFTSPALLALTCSPILFQRTTTKAGFHHLLRNVFVTILIKAPFGLRRNLERVLLVLAEEPYHYRREVGLENLREICLVLFAVIGLVWPRVSELAIAVLGDPIVEFAACSFMKIRDQDEVGGRRPGSGSYVLRRYWSDVEP
jgi:hypothetical protein